jgi:hypothetical protein
MAGIASGVASGLTGGLVLVPPPGRAALAALAPADLVLHFTVPARKG